MPTPLLLTGLSEEEQRDLLAAAQPLGRTLSVLALTWGNPVGQRQLWFGLSSDHYLALLFGLVLLALAQVLTEAARVAHENAEFV